MNKQEAIDKIEKLDGLTIKDEFIDFDIEMIPKGEVLEIIEQLDELVRLPEPKKPIIPRFVADWYEKNKDNFEFNVQCLCVHNCELDRKMNNWFDNKDNKPIETLVMMHKFGYEIEKEKLYIARNKTTGEHLYFNNAKKRFESGSLLTSYVKNIKAYHHTQDKLEKLNYWGNSLFEFEEVEE